MPSEEPAPQPGPQEPTSVNEDDVERRPLNTKIYKPTMYANPKLQDSGGEFGVDVG